MPPSSTVGVEASQPPSDEAATYRALVYASDSLQGKLICRGMERLGFRCDSVCRPTGARARLQGGCYDLILIDLRDARAEQVSVAGDAFAYRRRAKIMAIVSAGAGEMVKSLLAYGVDEIVTDPIDAESIGVKASSLLEIESWRQEAILRQRDVPLGKLLETIEQSLIERSAAVLRRIGDPFDSLGMPSSFREAIANGAARARQERSGGEEGGANRRRSARESVCLTASAIPLDEFGKACGDPFAVVVGDLSLTGARLAHTRPVSGHWHAMQWRCATVAERTVTVEAEVVRCETIGRFYEIGVRFL
ncbi:PilZ domain-containing protein [Botrimarina mediterranea]|uniref:Response regulatory domain-containing protein n=1 Tax=Botrimarina mediterranea TaxID=2528022 RepID=A0A518K4Z9_9BACT|nr:PilZ domain-containing protein [Botrimarina mediterranea]QDV72871.1 hypothetical protein Spa11_10550 [Botrimarina mediterranea]QDV77444.1 hypothetical protein K2D_10370 [Planctomycetes bacterium K2D]